MWTTTYQEAHEFFDFLVLCIIKNNDKINHEKIKPVFLRMRSVHEPDLLLVITLHSSYKWIIMLEKCGRSDLNDFHLK